MEASCYGAQLANRVGKYEPAGEILFRQQERWAANGQWMKPCAQVSRPADARKVRALAKDPAILAEVQAGHGNCSQTKWTSHPHHPDPPAAAYPSTARPPPPATI